MPYLFLLSSIIKHLLYANFETIAAVRSSKLRKNQSNQILSFKTEHYVFQCFLDNNVQRILKVNGGD